MSGVRYPDNMLTRAFEGNAGNRAGVRVASATPQPTARSAAFGQEVTPVQPLTPEERARLDREARAAGVQDERLGAPEPNERYASFEAAAQAGAPVERPNQVSVEAPRGGVGMFGGHPRLPNFGNVEGIDLMNNRIIIDGMDFPLSTKKAKELRLYAVKEVQRLVFKQMNAAARDITRRTRRRKDGGTKPASTDETVQRESEGGSEESSQ